MSTAERVIALLLEGMLLGLMTVALIPCELFGGEVAALVADPLLVSYDAASPPESTSAGLARVQSVSGRHAGCPNL